MHDVDLFAAHRAPTCDGDVAAGPCVLGWLVPSSPSLPLMDALELFLPSPTTLTFAWRARLAVPPTVWELVHRWNQYMLSQVFLDGAAVAAAAASAGVLVAPLLETADRLMPLDVSYMQLCLQHSLSQAPEDVYPTTHAIIPPRAFAPGTIFVHNHNVYRIESTQESPSNMNSQSADNMLVAKQAQSKPKPLDTPRQKLKVAKKRTFVHLPAIECRVHPLSHVWHECRWLPTIYFRWDTYRKCCQLHTALATPATISNESLVRLALTSAGGANNRLAFLGDALLKVVVSIALITSAACDETVRQARHHKLQNATLATHATSIHLAECIDHEGFRSWPTCLSQASSLSPVKPKVLATAVEALVAAAYLSNGLEGAIHVCMRIGLIDAVDVSVLRPSSSHCIPVEGLPHAFRHPEWAAALAMCWHDPTANPALVEWCRFLGEAIGYFAVARLLYRVDGLKPSKMTWVRTQMPRAVLGEQLRHLVESENQFLGQCWDAMLGVVTLDGGVDDAVACFEALTQPMMEALLATEDRTTTPHDV
ncbi:Aste57867_14790 [Aphanomyces stellatus]|uniref:Aste57867_14790 protein n=1 Tax=Aphanomyces stellatus TaxID=120398 RepID=A0A485L486_9STRA|nr:hypothetical protein As57867_014735 [Aphanomyces stellatus]VFT91608.1 Aste57867_14790 [Aphanomyces stellatus]